MKKKNIKWWIALPVAITTLPLLAAACGNTSGKEMDKKPSPNIPDMNGETKPNPNNSGNGGQNQGGNGGNNNMTPPKPDDKNNQGDKGDNNNRPPKPNDDSVQREKERLEKEKQEQEKREKERLEKERIEREKQEQEKRERESPEIQKKVRKIQYLSLFELIYLGINDIANSEGSKIFSNPEPFKKFKNIDESKFILSKIRRGNSIQDFAELYNKELSRNKFPESELSKMIIDSVVNKKMNPIDLGDNFINEYIKYISGENQNFGEIILNLFVAQTPEISNNLVFFTLLLEYSNNNFSSFSKPQTNSEYYILSFKKYWETLAYLKNNDFYNYPYLYYIRRNLKDYNLEDGKKNPLFAKRKYKDLAKEVFTILDGAINNKISLTQEQISKINELVKKIES
ncbi:hypothetical protein DA803_03175 [[Mycoplasma] phocae]|uniref:Uncharacterized protein n=1 Tax=[Mycoplasma] phocae TaxID=142651 RepID=A0A2Z5IRF3_9BACT|nr:hypothetical protein [[Mycoplasma] phocae]AXE61071.1 hypothetical protein DA803_03175 [[Mycoplasma] phocae]